MILYSLPSPLCMQRRGAFLFALTDVQRRGRALRGLWGGL